MRTSNARDASRARDIGHATPKRVRNLNSDAALLGESLVFSTEIGMRPLMERVLTRREILKA